MSKKNPEYDFKWCPGCGDFGVRRALEMAMQERMVKTEFPIENNVVVAGIAIFSFPHKVCEFTKFMKIDRIIPKALGLFGRQSLTADYFFTN